MPENTQHEPGPLCDETCQPDLVENPVPLEELRAAVLESQDETAELVTNAFREGMSAGLDFAYRVAEDLFHAYQGVARLSRADAVREVMERLVSEHDMRSAQPIRAIQVERATGQAADAMLAGLNEALRTVQARNQDDVRAENTETIRESVQPTPDPLEAVRPDLTQGCDGPCCRQGDNVFNWVNMNPDHTSAPAPITPTYVRCMCGDVNMSHRNASQVLLGDTYHRANAPCYEADDPEPENVQTASDERAALRMEHSCTCGEIPGLVSGMVPVPQADGWMIIHRPEGEPCTMGADPIPPVRTPDGTCTGDGEANCACRGEES